MVKVFMSTYVVLVSRLNIGFSMRGAPYTIKNLIENRFFFIYMKIN